MTFAARAASRQRGDPAYALLFRYAAQSDAVVAITDADVPLTISVAGVPVVFNPEPLDVGNIISSGSLDKSNLTVTTKHSNVIAERFKSFGQTSVVGLTIMQGYVGDPDSEWPVIWVGRVLAAQFQAKTCDFTCQSVFTSLKRLVMRRRYVRQCPLVLYGSKCRASLGAASSNFTPEVVTDFTVQMPTLWVPSAVAVKYRGGLAMWDGPTGRQFRTIVKVADDFRTLTLSGPTFGLEGGEQVTVAFGCSHQLTYAVGASVLAGDCVDLHHNVNNFGGDLFLPVENPVGSINIFY